MQNTTHLGSEYICNFISVLRGLRQHNISILEQFYKTAKRQTLFKNSYGMINTSYAQFNQHAFCKQDY